MNTLNFQKKPNNLKHKQAKTLVFLGLAFLLLACNNNEKGQVDISGQTTFIYTDSLKASFAGISVINLSDSTTNLSQFPDLAIVMRNDSMDSISIKYKVRQISYWGGQAAFEIKNNVYQDTLLLYFKSKISYKLDKSRAHSRVGIVKTSPLPNLYDIISLEISMPDTNGITINNQLEISW